MNVLHFSKMAMEDILDSQATVYKERDTQGGQGLPKLGALEN